MLTVGGSVAPSILAPRHPPRPVEVAQWAQGEWSGYKTTQIKPVHLNQSKARSPEGLLTPTHHGAPAAPAFQPLVPPGRHAGGLQLLPDHALLRPVFHLVQPPQGVHLPAAAAGTGEALPGRNNLREQVQQHGSVHAFHGQSLTRLKTQDAFRGVRTPL